MPNILPRTPAHAAQSLLGLALGLAVVALGASPQLVAAQNRQVAQLASPNQPAAISPSVDEAGASLVMYSVRNDLRDLVMAQEAYWHDRQSYASDVGALKSFHIAPGVNVQIMHAGIDGWAARATYGKTANGPAVRSCVVWVGAIDPAQRPATEIEHKIYPEAETSCDGDGYNAKTEWAAAGESYMTYALQKLIVNETRYYNFHHRYTALAAQLDPFIWDRECGRRDRRGDVDRLGCPSHVRAFPRQDLRSEAWSTHRHRPPRGNRQCLHGSPGRSGHLRSAVDKVARGDAFRCEARRGQEHDSNGRGAGCGDCSPAPSVSRGPWL